MNLTPKRWNLVVILVEETCQKGKKTEKKKLKEIVKKSKEKKTLKRKLERKSNMKVDFVNIDFFLYF